MSDSESNDSVHVSTVIDAPPDRVWAALTDPALIKRYFFGANVETDWRPGSSIAWSGDFNGKPYRDKGTIEEVVPGKRLGMTHWSPMSGLADRPENYHRVTYDLEPAGTGTRLTLTQRNLTGMAPEKARDNWRPVLEGLKRVLASVG